MPARDEVVAEIVEAIRSFAELGSGTKSQRKVHDGRLRNCRRFLVYERDEPLFAPLDFISTVTDTWSTYQVQLSDAAKEELKGLPAITSADVARFQSLHDRFLAYCDAHNLAPSSHHLEHQYWIVK